MCYTTDGKPLAISAAYKIEWYSAREYVIATVRCWVGTQLE